MMDAHGYELPGAYAPASAVVGTALPAPRRTGPTPSRRAPVVILGVDPGLAALGYGVIEVDGQRMRRLAHGVIKTQRAPGVAVTADLPSRVGELAQAFGTLVDQHRPAAAALEEFRFYGQWITSSLQLSNVVGMLREALRARGIPVAEYSAQTIKRAVTGYANADKAQVQQMVKVLLGLVQVPRPNHAADALAAAITHAGRLR